jgi:hypothetical protein
MPLHLPPRDHVLPGDPRPLHPCNRRRHLLLHLAQPHHGRAKRGLNARLPFILKGRHLQRHLGGVRRRRQPRRQCLLVGLDPSAELLSNALRGGARHLALQRGDLAQQIFLLTGEVLDMLALAAVKWLVYFLGRGWRCCRPRVEEVGWVDVEAVDGEIGAGEGESFADVLVTMVESLAPQVRQKI